MLTIYLCCLCYLTYLVGQRFRQFAFQTNHGLSETQIVSDKHGRSLSETRFRTFFGFAFQTNQFVGKGSYLLVEVEPDGVCLKRDFGPFSDLRFRQTVPNNIVLLVMARPRCHALPVLPAACGCGATLSRHFTDHVTFSRHFQRFFKE